MAWRRAGKPILKDKDGNYLWYEGLNITFKDPEYRIHPLMGHQVRSRHTYVPEKQSEQPATGHVHQRATLTPKEFDPAYKYPQEPSFGIGDLMGVKQYPVTLEVEPDYPQPDFSDIKSRRLRDAADALEFTIGFDHRTNKHVLYSPISERGLYRHDRAGQAMWMRSIGVTPTYISQILNVKIKTIQLWLATLKDQPLVDARKTDWAVGYADNGELRYFSPASTIDAPKHQYVGEKGVNINPVTGIIE